MAKAVYEKVLTEEGEFVVGGVGSVFSSRTLRNSFLEHAKKLLPSATVVKPLVSYAPVRGLAAILCEKKGGFRGTLSTG